MLTRCPECGTWFKVTEAHLALADGWVHCGQCDTRFDARENLDDGMSEPGAGGAEDQEPPVPRLVESATGPEETVVAPPASVDETPAPIFPFTLSHSSRREIAWVAGTILLVLAIGLQTLWWWRDDWAATPTGLSLVQALCRIAPCRARPPRAPERIEVLDRSLQPDPRRPGVLRFQLKMVSRAGHSQPYPRLELRLYDHLERLTAARRFEPADYLPSDADREGLLKPDQPLALDLELEDPGNHVTGFQIDFL